VTVKSKVCICCNEEKPAAKFIKDTKRSDGLGSYCGSCRYKKYPRKASVRRLERVKYCYGLEPDDYKKLIDSTPNCPICGSEEPLVVDHNHSTGEVRGLICQPCNKALGFFRDNTTSMENAIKYLNNEPLR
jgi:hypothetical protein